MSIKEVWFSVSEGSRKSILNILVTIFLILFTYPLIRSSTQTFFIQAYGSESMPYAWFASVLALTVAIGISNLAQARWGVHRLFTGLSSLSIIIFMIFYALLLKGHLWSSYVLFIWKEVYIVMLLHLVLGYTNSLLSLSQMRVLFGPIGAVGSVGGILGGLVTSVVAREFGNGPIMYLTTIFLALPCFFFINTDRLTTKLVSKSDLDKGVTPLEAIKDIRHYVICLAVVVGLSQFCISIADFEFNLLFEKIVTDNSLRTAYLGNLYAGINLVTLIIQLVIIPVMLSRFKVSTSHYLIPIFFLAVNYIGLGLGASMLWPVAMSFILFKATGYSLFDTAKEILYHPLSYIQKYGAKYITDMFSYRFSKAVIAVILIMYKELWFLHILMTACLVAWIISLIILFKLERKYFSEKI